MTKVLLTTTSFIDTNGIHHDELNKHNFVIEKRRGPLSESEIFEGIEEFDALICGDDEITRKVIEKGVNGKLKIISKYGTGLDKIDLKAAEEFGVIVRNCPNVNHKSVAEHVFALLLSFSRNLIKENEEFQKNKWTRITGSDINGIILGVIGTGAIGTEVVKRAKAFDLNVIAFDVIENEMLKKEFGVEYYSSVEEVLGRSDYITLHVPLNKATKCLINDNSINSIKKGAVLINTARGDLVDEQSIIHALDKGIISGYLADVLSKEPVIEDHLFVGNKKIVVTPHIGSRTSENVQKQGLMAVNNLLNELEKYG